MTTRRKIVKITLFLFTVLAAIGSRPLIVLSAEPRDLPEIQRAGVIRHLGVPYANFVTGSGDGMDVELIQLFAEHLGVRYEYVRTSWKDVIGDLTGKSVKPKGTEIEISGDHPIRGDLIANGFTVLPWRKKIIDYGTATFPTQIWVMARADSVLKPIAPTGQIAEDIAVVKSMLGGRSILGMANTSLEPGLYHVAETRRQGGPFFREISTNWRRPLSTARPRPPCWMFPMH